MKIKEAIIKICNIFNLFSLFAVNLIANPIGPEVMTLPPNWAVTGTEGMVAAANPHAARAGLEILKKGGSAADAILAMQWALNVVEPQSSGIGGGGFILYYDKKSNKVVALDGREESPEGLSIRDFQDSNSKLVAFYPDRITLPSSVGVPGAVALLAELQRKYGSGRVQWADTFESAIKLAKKGFYVSPRLATALNVNQKRMYMVNADKAALESLSVFFKNGRALEAGEFLRQPQLAKTFELLADRKEAYFYRAELARSLIDSLQKAKSLNGKPSKMSMDDLARYMPVYREPVSMDYLGNTIYTMPPPSSGTILLQSLACRNFLFHRENRVQTDDKTTPGIVKGLHGKLECEKLAFADREKYIGDPDFYQSDLQGFHHKSLLESQYVKTRAGLIDDPRALPAPVAPGNPLSTSAPQRKPQPSQSSEQTTHLVAVDAEGNAASFTSTIEHSFGSGIIVAGRGFFLNNQLTDFSFVAGSVNTPEPGLRIRKSAQNKAARTLGGKRPRSSMSPVIVFREGEFLLATGSPGGTQIIGAVASVLINILEKKMDVQSAINEPRMLHRNGEKADAEWPFWQNPLIMTELEKRGHKFNTPNQWNRAIGGVQAIYRDPKTQILWGGADLRREGVALPVKSRP